MQKLMAWLRQPTTIHGLAVVAGAIGAGLAQVTAGNPKIDVLVGLAVYALTHLGINDNSASSQAISKVASDLANAAVQRRLATVAPELFGDGVAAFQAVMGAQLAAAVAAPVAAAPVAASPAPAPPVAAAGAPLVSIAVLLVLGLSLGACNGVTVTPAEMGAAQTLGTLAAANSTTAADLIAKGQLFCQQASVGVSLAPAVSAVIEASTGAPVTVIGKAAADVAQVCAAIGGVPVPAPTATAPASVPVVRVPTT